MPIADIRNAVIYYIDLIYSMSSMAVRHKLRRFFQKNKKSSGQAVTNVYNGTHVYKDYVIHVFDCRPARCRAVRYQPGTGGIDPGILNSGA